MDIRRDRSREIDEEHDRNVKMTGYDDPDDCEHRRWGKPHLCRCGPNHGRVKSRLHPKLGEFYPYCVKCGGWLTDEQCRTRNEGTSE